MSGQKNVLAYKFIFTLPLSAMDKTLSPQEAFSDFLQFAEQNGIRLGNDVAQAKRDNKGGRLTAKGTPIKLGVARIKRLLERYCPGRYEFREVVVVHDGQ